MPPAEPGTDITGPAVTWPVTVTVAVGPLQLVKL